MLDEDDKKEDVVEDNDLEISNDDKELADGGEVAKAADSEDDDLATYSEGVKKRINKLTYKTREAERREQEALEYARAVKAELDTIKKRETTLSKSFETEAETRLQTQERLFRDQLRTAIDTGDVDKQVEIQSSLSQLASEKERLRNYKAYRQEEDSRPVTPPPPPPQQRVVPDQKAQNWAERNTWFGADRVMTAAAYAIHDDLLGEGFNASGDAYYRELDKRIRDEFPQKFKPVETKKPSSTVASGRPAQVKKSSGDTELTDTQKVIARRLGVSYDDYKRQLKLVQERAD
jgi:hypothetical protein